MGLWLLVPEHLRLGTWDLLRGWSGEPAEKVEPRLALQLVHEAALCVAGVRQSRALSQRGMEIANGLPFIATDQAVHDLLASHTMAQCETLQIALGRIRRTGQQFPGGLLAIDPHRMRSQSKRQMIRRQSHRDDSPVKVAQTFFCLDVQTAQPLAMTTASASRSAAQAAPELLRLAAEILGPRPSKPLVLLDTEHVNAQLFKQVLREGRFDLLVPQPRREKPYQKLAHLEDSLFTPRWAGYATAVLPYRMANGGPSLYQLVQRCGEKPGQYQYKAFLSTRDDDEVRQLTRDFPQRWSIEEFFNLHQALGWQRAGTLNLNIRYGQMTLALVAQAVLHQLRQRLPPPLPTWDARHLAQHLLAGLDGDLRVHDDTVVVTYYNAPQAQHLQPLYENLPRILEREGVDPRIPWLYGYKLDFRFR